MMPREKKNSPKQSRFVFFSQFFQFQQFPIPTMKIPPNVIDFYTDILSHSFEAGGGGERLAAGTTTGKVIVIERDWENNEAFCKMEASLPNAVLGLHWGRPGIFAGAKSHLCLFKPNAFGEYKDVASQIFKFECAGQIQDVTSNPSGSTVFGACEDCKVRAWDVESQKLLLEFVDHKMPVEVCKVNDEYLVCGGQDGNVVVYDAGLRSQKPVASFDQGKSTVTSVDISDTSTWVASGSFSSPVVYNLKNAATLPQVPIHNPQKIYTIHFDNSTLWWGGGGGRIFKSHDLTTLSSELPTSYGEATIFHVYSITTSSSSKRLSAAGSSTGILFSDNSEYWEAMVHL